MKMRFHKHVLLWALTILPMTALGSGVVIITPDRHHIGDSRFSTNSNCADRLSPDAEGADFGRGFSVPADRISRAVLTIKELCGHDSDKDPVQVWLNGAPIGRITNGQDIRIDIPVERLKLGGQSNYLQIASGTAGGDVDDLEFEDVRLRYSSVARRHPTESSRPKVRAVQFQITSAEAPHATLEEISMGGAFRVQVKFERASPADNPVVFIAATTGAQKTVTTRRISQELYRSEAIPIDDFDVAPFDEIEAEYAGQTASVFVSAPTLSLQPVSPLQKTVDPGGSGTRGSLLARLVTNDGKPVQGATIEWKADGLGGPSVLTRTDDNGVVRLQFVVTGAGETVMSGDSDSRSRPMRPGAWTIRSTLASKDLRGMLAKSEPRFRIKLIRRPVVRFFNAAGGEIKSIFHGQAFHVELLHPQGSPGATLELKAVSPTDELDLTLKKLSLILYRTTRRIEVNPSDRVQPNPDIGAPGNSKITIRYAGHTANLKVYDAWTAQELESITKYLENYRAYIAALLKNSDLTSDERAALEFRGGLADRALMVLAGKVIKVRTHRIAIANEYIRLLSKPIEQFEGIGTVQADASELPISARRSGLTFGSKTEAEAFYAGRRQGLRLFRDRAFEVLHNQYEEAKAELSGIITGPVIAPIYGGWTLITGTTLEGEEATTAELIMSGVDVAMVAFLTVAKLAGSRGPLARSLARAAARSERASRRTYVRVREARILAEEQARWQQANIKRLQESAQRVRKARQTEVSRVYRTQQAAKNALVKEVQRNRATAARRAAMAPRELRRTFFEATFEKIKKSTKGGETITRAEAQRRMSKAHKKFEELVPDESVRQKLMRVPGMEDVVADLAGTAEKLQGARYQLRKLTKFMSEGGELRIAEDRMPGLPKFASKINPRTGLPYKGRGRRMSQAGDAVTADGIVKQYKSYSELNDGLRAASNQAQSDLFRYADQGWKDSTGQTVSGRFEYHIERSQLKSGVDSRGIARARRLQRALNSWVQNAFRTAPVPVEIRIIID